METSEQPHVTASTRRAFLRGTGALVIGGVIVPIGAGVVGTVAAGAQTEASEPDPVQLAAFAESLELAVVQVHQAAASSGKLSAGTAQTATTFAAHHTDHARAYAAAAGAQATGRPNRGLLPTLLDQLENARDEEALLRVLYDIEDATAATHLYLLGVFKQPSALHLAASVLPVESQHAVVLGRALGETVEAIVPSFENQDNAVDLTKFPLTTTTTTSTTTA